MSGSGNLQVVKKVVATEGKFKDYWMKYSKAMCLDLHLRLYTNVDGTFVTTIRVYSGKVYVFDDVATMEVGDRSLTEDTISSKLVYFVKSDGGGGVALEGDIETSGARDWKSRFSWKTWPKVLLERLVKLDL